MAAADPNIVIFAPLADDAAALAQIVGSRTTPAKLCRNADDLVVTLDDNPFCVLITEEGAGPATAEMLHDLLAREPVWSTIPLIFIVSDTERLPPACRETLAHASPATVTILKRPVPPATLRSVVDNLTELRRRQFETAALLEKLEESERYQSFLVSELKHRTANILSLIQAAVWMTERHHNDTAELAEALCRRLDGLAEAHRSLTDAEHGQILLHDILRRHIEPHCLSVDQLALEGEEITLAGRLAFDITLVIHEMAINAAKYGALSAENGRVHISWSKDRANQLSLIWTECGGPPVNAPESTSFGSRMIEAIPTDHGGTSQLEYRREGLIWTLRLPLEGRVSDGQT